MRCLVMMAALVCSVVLPASQAPADEVDPSSREPDSRAAVVSTVSVQPFEVRNPAVPDWMGRSFQRSVQDELRTLSGVELLDAEASTTKPAKPADYTVKGRCAGSEFRVDVSLDVLHQPSQSVVHSVTVSGDTTDLLQIKSALRQQVRHLFSPEKLQRTVPQSMPGADAGALQPAAQPAPAGDLPGSRFAGSDLERALDDPETFERDLDYYGRYGSGYLAPYYGYGYGYGGYGYHYGLSFGSYGVIHRRVGSVPALQVHGHYHHGGPLCE